MIALSCIVVLAFAIQISASECGCGQNVVLPNGSNSPVVLFSSGNTGSAFADCSSVNRNLIAKGKYPVALRNCGPALDQQIPVFTSRVTAPVQEKPTVRLPATIPAPRTISHSCTCFKTIVRPRVHQQLITVPIVQRYVETSHKPVVENIQYEALPVTSEGPNCSFRTGIQLVQVGTGCSSSELVSGCSCGCQAQKMEIPFIQVPQMQTVEVPNLQVVQAQRVHALQVPQIQTLQIS